MRLGPQLVQTPGAALTHAPCPSRRRLRQRLLSSGTIEAFFARVSSGKAPVQVIKLLKDYEPPNSSDEDGEEGGDEGDEGGDEGEGGAGGGGEGEGGGGGGMFVEVGLHQAVLDMICEVRGSWVDAGLGE